MLDNNMAIPLSSSWASPCLLVDKSDTSPRFCTNYRKVNKVTKSDSFPLPRMEDCIDQVGATKFVSKFDLLKGYWQVPLSSREGCAVYLDDVVIFSNRWDTHVQRVRALFSRLAEARLTVNLAKCEFARATVTYLGRVVGQGHMRPVDAKIRAVVQFPAPSTKKELMRFLGLVGYYRSFCKNFSTVVAPLTDLLKGKVKLVWPPLCQSAFENVKALLCLAPVLAAPCLDEPFKILTDASQVGAGAVLLQEEGGIDKPVLLLEEV